MPTGKVVEEDDAARFTYMLNDLDRMSVKIHSRQNHSALFSPADESAINVEFNAAMSDLQFLVKGVNFPVQGYYMKPMQCIEYDEESEYIKRNPNVKPSYLAPL